MNFFHIFIDNKHKTPNMKELECGKRIKLIRESLKIKQYKLAEESKVDQSSLSRIESGQEGIPTKLVLTLCEKYNVNANFIIGVETTMFRNQYNDVVREPTEPYYSKDDLSIQEEILKLKMEILNMKKQMIKNG